MSANQSVSLLTIGSEIVDGRIVDTNSAFISELLAGKGFTVSRHLSCTDCQDEIISSLQFLLDSSQFVLITGGLGPTSDDITRESIAAMLGKELQLDAESLERIEQFFAERNRDVATSNRKQAYFPEGARVIENPVGTADGFEMQMLNSTQEEVVVIALPGVPREMEKMLRGDVLGRIKESLPAPAEVGTAYFHCFGLPESVAQNKIAALDLDSSVSVSYRASFPVVTIRLTMLGNLARKDELTQSVAGALGEEYIFSSQAEGSLGKMVHELLLESGKTVSVAESCTGGMIGSYLTKYPGSSEYFSGGAITYSNQAKHDRLGVAEDSIEMFGAVSDIVAVEMASGARGRFHSDLAISVTGIAGPGGGSSDKPVGTFFVGISTMDEVRAGQYFFKGSRETIRRIATGVALDTLRRELLGLAPLITYERSTDW